MNATEAGRALTFAWERVRHVPLVLPGFILLVFAGHVGAFFLFRVVYPPQASLPMPPPTITMLDPSRPDHQALLRWAEAEDTAPLLAQTGITERLLDVPYRPSYATVRTAPLTLPSEPARVQYPPPRDPVAFIRSTDAKPIAATPIPRVEPTRVTFSGELAPRLRGAGALTFSTKSSDPLDSAEFLVGVTDRGEIRFVTLQRSSGSAAHDAEASDLLTRLSLAPAEAPITWGRATIHWSADTYTPKRP